MGGFGDFGICNFVPQLCGALNLTPDSDFSDAGGTATSFLADRVQVILSIVFIAIILIAVFVIVRAGVLYIQSQGDESKIEQAQKAIRNVFIGIAVLFVGLVGIILVLAFFGGTELLGGFGDEECRINSSGAVVCPGDDGFEDN